MDPLALFAMALLSVSAIQGSAAKLYCSIHPARETPVLALPGLAKISQEDASRFALAGVRARSKQVVRGALEVEKGCLVYSFDIQVSGKKEVEEILVDAGNGRIITHKHEAAKQLAAERAKDKQATTRNPQ